MFTLVGGWREHRRHGLCFDAVCYERITPESTGSDGRVGPIGFLTVDRVRFGHVDELGRRLRVPPPDSRRVRAAEIATVTTCRRTG